MNQNKYAWLEFDENKFTTNLCDFGMAADLRIKMLSAKEQHSQDKIIMEKLLEIVEMQREALEAIRTNYKPYGDVLTFSELAKETISKTDEMLKGLV